MATEAVNLVLEPRSPRQLGEEGLIVFWRDGRDPGRREGLASRRRAPRRLPVVRRIPWVGTPAAFAWTGTRRLFDACGFEVVGKAMMRFRAGRRYNVVAASL